jgi:hypothetical protein
MNLRQRSYLKTCAMAAGAGAIAMLCAYVARGLEPRALQVGLVALFGLMSFGCTIVVVAGLLVIWRDRLLDLGGEDLFLRFNADRSEAVLAGRCGQRPTTRALIGWLRVGEEVAVKTLAEIEKTLDAQHSLDGLVFQPEMAAFCGRRFRVFRVVDKIYDYNRSRKLRRLVRSVSLADVRCDGAAHGACEARCGLLWKEDWLRRIPPVEAARTEFGDTPASLADVAGAAAPVGPAHTQGLASGPRTYRCQFTQLAEASIPLRAWDIRQDVRPLLAGNVTFAAYAIVLLTRLFECVQTLRGGIGFPAQKRGEQAKTPAVSHGLAHGQSVRVLTRDEISETLDSGWRNRGLWFDRELLRHCGQRYTVSSRVNRIIDVVTGCLLELKTNCVTLDGVTSSGEFLRLCPQHEYIFWREAWLRPDETPASERGGEANGRGSPCPVR